MARSVRPPEDLGTGGRDLWTSCLKRDDALAESANPIRRVLLEACRLTDQIDALQRVVSADGVVISTEFGDKVHPALVELGKQRSLLARLLVALRMPDEATGQKPQRRGLRTQGPSKPGGRKAGTVSSLDRARARAGGA